MHSSRMHTVRNSSRLLAGGCPLGAGTPPPRTRSPRSRHPPRSRNPPGSRHPHGDLLQSMLGYYLQGLLGYHHPCGQTHTCKNITFATSLRPVTNITREACKDYKVVNCRIIMLLQIIKLSRR